MGGIILGTLCLLGFVKVWRRHRCRTRGIARRLGATPEQEKVLKDSLEAVQRAGWQARAEWPAIRADAARALRADDFDEGALAAAMDRARAALAAFETATREALRPVHATLQPAQRQRLADLVQFGPRGCR